MKGELSEDELLALLDQQDRSYAEEEDDEELLRFLDDTEEEHYRRSLTAGPEGSLEEERYGRRPMPSSTSSSTSTSSDPLAARLGLSSGDKAGMQSVDKEKANKIIYDMSKGSKFFKNEQLKSEQVEREVQRMLLKLKEVQHQDDALLLKSIDAKLATLESSRDLTQTFFHIDMDAFYASVEIRDNPQLRGLPIAVGGNHMLTTASYEARKFGVRSAMPGFIAKQLCPELIIVPTHFDKYKEASRLTREVYSLFDPHFKAYSLDEASLHLTPYLTKHPDESPEQVAEKIRAMIKERTQLTCSIGIAPNRKLAKVCCDVNKPDGQFRLQPDREAIVSFLKDLPVRKISRIGKVTEQMLKGLGITKCSDIRDKRAVLFRLFKSSSAEFFLRASLGIWPTTSGDDSTPSSRKSVSKMRTFQASGSRDYLMSQAREVAQSLAKSMAKKRLAGKNVALYLKTDEFKMFSRSTMLNRHICAYEDILAEATRLLEKEFPIKLRLLGIRISHFREDQANQRPISSFFGPGASPPPILPSLATSPFKSPTSPVSPRASSTSSTSSPTTLRSPLMRALSFSSPSSPTKDISSSSSSKRHERKRGLFSQDDDDEEDGKDGMIREGDEHARQCKRGRLPGSSEEAPPLGTRARSPSSPSSVGRKRPAPSESKQRRKSQPHSPNRTNRKSLDSAQLKLTSFFTTSG